MATQYEAPPLVATEAKGPPLPKWAYKVVNPAMMGILRSPWHGLLSNDLMILIFDGRKSGKRFMIPVGYLREGNRLYLFSHSSWAKNFIGGAPVAMRLGGKLVRGTARVVDDPAIIRKTLQLMIAKRGEGMAERMGLATRDDQGNVQPALPTGTTFITIDLEGA